MTRTLQAKLLILAVFVIGTLTGAVGTDLYQTRLQANFSADEQGADSTQRRRRPPIERFEDFLEMNEEQRAQLAEILQRSRERYRDLQSQTRPMYQALTEQSQNEIRAILSEEQGERYEAWLLRIEENRNSERARRDNNR